MESGMATSTPTGGGSEFTENLLSVLERETEFERHRQNIPKYEIQRFMELKDTTEFLNFNYEKLKGILESDDLNVSCEEDAFDAIKRWYKHDTPGRERHLPDLIGCLRLPQFDANFILTNIYPLPGCETLALQTIVWDSQPLARNVIALKFKEPRQSSRKNVKEKFYFAVETTGFDRFKYILRYNKSVDKWLRYAAIDTFRVFWARVVFNDDNLIFTGGRQGRQANEIISLNLRSKRWKQLPAMTYIRDDHIVVPLDGKMYAIGGENGRSLLASVEVFTSTGGWRTVRDMNTRRSAAAAVAFNGNIFVMGGDGGCEPLNSVERYDPNTDIWTFCASTNNSFSYHGAAVHKGFIYIVGKGAAERYDPRRDEWTNICACPSAIASPGCVSLNNQLWTIGGWWCGPKDCSYVYDEESDRWVEKSRLPKSAIYYCFTTSEALL